MDEPKPHREIGSLAEQKTRAQSATKATLRSLPSAANDSKRRLTSRPFADDAAGPYKTLLAQPAPKFCRVLTSAASVDKANVLLGVSVSAFSQSWPLASLKRNIRYQEDQTLAPGVGGTAGADPSQSLGIRRKRALPDRRQPSRRTGRTGADHALTVDNAYKYIQDD